VHWFGNEKNEKQVGKQLGPDDCYKG